MRKASRPEVGPERRHLHGPVTGHELAPPACVDLAMATEGEASMMGTWWVLWMAFMLVLCVSPWGTDGDTEGGGRRTRGTCSGAAVTRLRPEERSVRSSTSRGGGAATSCGSIILIAAVWIVSAMWWPFWGRW